MNCYSLFLGDDGQMQTDSFDMPGLLLLTPRRHGDARGHGSEVFRQNAFEAAAGQTASVQDDLSRPQQKSVVCGLHPHAPLLARSNPVRAARPAIS